MSDRSLIALRLTPNLLHDFDMYKSCRTIVSEPFRILNDRYCHSHLYFYVPREKKKRWYLAYYETKNPNLWAAFCKYCIYVYFNCTRLHLLSLSPAICSIENICNTSFYYIISLSLYLLNLNSFYMYSCRIFQL